MNNWNEEPVLITGGGGFIGSHLTEFLVRLGAKVRVFAHYNSRNDSGLLRYAADDVRQEIQVVFGDLRDADAVRRAAADVRCIFHLGALIGIPYSYLSPRDVVDTNVLGTLNVLEAGRHHEVERLIHTSSSEVYGTAIYVPMNEEHPLKGQSPYSASKIGAEKIAESYFLSFDLPVTIVRPFNTYGPRQSARALIPTVISQALAGGPLRLGSLSPTRDFTFVADTVNGMAAVAMSDGAAGETINLGTGSAVSVGEVVDIVGQLLGRELTVSQDSIRIRPAASEVGKLLADASKVKALCGWSASTTIREGLERTIEWIDAHQSDFQSNVYGV